MAGDKIKNGKYLGQVEVMNEMKLAKKEERPADFSNKTTSEFPLILDKVKFGLNMENSIVLGPLYFGEIIIEGDLILKNAKINGSLYLAMSEIMGDLILEDSKITGTVNLVGAEVGRSIKASNMNNTGFVSLSKAIIDGNIDLENARIENAKYDDLSVRGDLFLDSARIKGSLNLSKALIDGAVDLDETIIDKDFVFSQAKSKKGKIETNTAKIGGRKIS